MDQLSYWQKLQLIKDLIASQQLIIILSDQLILEIQSVTQRPKLEKYFSKQKVEELIQFLQATGQIYHPAVKNQVCRDPKDNFLLDLIDSSKADYIVTGDKDLLVLNHFRNTQIITPADFEGKLKKASR